MYADDTKIYRTITQPDDTKTLQTDLDRLYNWTNDWLLKLHREKSEHMHIGHRTQPVAYTLTDDKKTLTATTLENDLGSHTDPDLLIEDALECEDSCGGPSAYLVKVEELRK